eukprot:189918-Prorocentrum_minimum.AAC.2
MGRLTDHPQGYSSRAIFWAGRFSGQARRYLGAERKKEKTKKMGGAAPWPRPRGLRRARKKTKNDPKRTLASAARAPMRARAASSPLPAGQSGPVSWRSIHWATRRSQSLPPRRPSPATPITSTLSQPVSITLASNVPPPRSHT